MCGSSGGGSNKALEYQKQQDAERARNIKRGKEQLDRIFAGLEGAEYRVVNPIASMSRDEYLEGVRNALAGNVETERNRKWVGRIGASDNAGWDERRRRVTTYNTYLNDQGRQALRDLGLTDSQIGGYSADGYASLYDQAVNNPGSYQRFEGVSDPIWEQQAQAYLDFANPQLDDQYQDAREDMVYALQRQGQAESSLAGDKWADLERDYKLQQQGVAEQARGYANQAQNDIMSQKNSLLQTLNATADPGAVTASARDAIASLSNTPSFSPLGPLFQNATAGLAAGLQGNQNYQIDQNTNQVIYGSDPDRGSGRVIR